MNCPSYTAAITDNHPLGKQFGGAMCARYGTVLSRPGQRQTAESKISESVARGCNAYMKPRPSKPERVDLAVAFPILTGAEGETPDNNVSSCAQCKFYVASSTVKNEFGWTAGICSGKGKLILDTRQVIEAKKCELRQHATLSKVGAKPHFSNIQLIPHFDEGFGVVDPLKAFNVSSGVDPAEYPTDAPVDDETKKAGIRAWRKIEDAEGTGNYVLIPCYDPEFFPEGERAKIPRSGDKEHPELYIDHGNLVYAVAVAWFGLDEAPALYGSAGLGKTELFRHMAWMMCLPFERFPLNARSDIEDLAGSMHFENSETTYKYGRVTQAWAKPCVICLDEPNTAPPDVWQFLRPLLDNSKTLTLDMNEGEVIPRSDDCYLGMAMNPAWDARNIGAAPISDADNSRLFHIEVTLPPPQVERRIIADRVKLDGWEIKDVQLNMLMGIAEELRSLASNGTLPVSWGVRDQIKVARALRWFGTLTAYRRATADALEPEARRALLAVVEAHSTGPSNDTEETPF